MKNKLRIGVFLCTFFLLLPQANKASDGFRNPALLFVSVPVITAVIAVIATGAFSKAEIKSPNELLPSQPLTNERIRRDDRMLLEAWNFRKSELLSPYRIPRISAP